MNEPIQFLINRVFRDISEKVNEYCDFYRISNIDSASFHPQLWIDFPGRDILSVVSRSSGNISEFVYKECINQFLQRLKKVDDSISTKNLIFLFVLCQFLSIIPRRGQDSEIASILCELLNCPMLYQNTKIKFLRIPIGRIVQNECSSGNNIFPKFFSEIPAIIDSIQFEVIFNTLHYALVSADSLNSFINVFGKLSNSMNQDLQKSFYDQSFSAIHVFITKYPSLFKKFVSGVSFDIIRSLYNMVNQNDPKQSSPHHPISAFFIGCLLCDKESLEGTAQKEISSFFSNHTVLCSKNKSSEQAIISSLCLCSIRYIVCDLVPESYSKTLGEILKQVINSAIININRFSDHFIIDYLPQMISLEIFSNINKDSELCSIVIRNYPSVQFTIAFCETFSIMSSGFPQKIQIPILQKIFSSKFSEILDKTIISLIQDVDNSGDKKKSDALMTILSNGIKTISPQIEFPVFIGASSSELMNHPIPTPISLGIFLSTYLNPKSLVHFITSLLQLIRKKQDYCLPRLLLFLRNIFFPYEFWMKLDSVSYDVLLHSLYSISNEFSSLIMSLIANHSDFFEHILSCFSQFTIWICFVIQRRPVSQSCEYDIVVKITNILFLIESLYSGLVTQWSKKLNSTILVISQKINQPIPLIPSTSTLITLYDISLESINKGAPNINALNSCFQYFHEASRIASKNSDFNSYQENLIYSIFETNINNETVVKGIIQSIQSINPSDFLPIFVKLYSKIIRVLTSYDAENFKSVIYMLQVLLILIKKVMINQDQYEKVMHICIAFSDTILSDIFDDQTMISIDLFICILIHIYMQKEQTFYKFKYVISKQILELMVFLTNRSFPNISNTISRLFDLLQCVFRGFIITNDKEFLKINCPSAIVRVKDFVSSIIEIANHCITLYGSDNVLQYSVQNSIESFLSSNYHMWLMQFMLSIPKSNEVFQNIVSAAISNISDSIDFNVFQIIKEDDSFTIITPYLKFPFEAFLSEYYNNVFFFEQFISYVNYFDCFEHYLDLSSRFFTPDQKHLSLRACFRLSLSARVLQNLKNMYEKGLIQEFLITLQTNYYIKKLIPLYNIENSLLECFIKPFLTHPEMYGLQYITERARIDSFILEISKSHLYNQIVKDISTISFLRALPISYTTFMDSFSVIMNCFCCPAAPYCNEYWHSIQYFDQYSNELPYDLFMCFKNNNFVSITRQHPHCIRIKLLPHLLSDEQKIKAAVSFVIAHIPQEEPIVFLFDCLHCSTLPDNQLKMFFDRIPQNILNNAKQICFYNSCYLIYAFVNVYLPKDLKTKVNFVESYSGYLPDEIIPKTNCYIKVSNCQIINDIFCLHVLSDGIVFSLSKKVGHSEVKFRDYYPYSQIKEVKIMDQKLFIFMMNNQALTLEHHLANRLKTIIENKLQYFQYTKLFSSGFSIDTLILNKSWFFGSVICAFSSFNSKVNRNYFGILSQSNEVYKKNDINYISLSTTGMTECISKIIKSNSSIVDIAMFIIVHCIRNQLRLNIDYRVLLKDLFNEIGSNIVVFERIVLHIIGLLEVFPESQRFINQVFWDCINQKEQVERSIILLFESSLNTNILINTFSSLISNNTEIALQSLHLNIKSRPFISYLYPTIITQISIPNEILLDLLYFSFYQMLYDQSFTFLFKFVLESLSKQLSLPYPESILIDFETVSIITMAELIKPINDYLLSIDHVFSDNMKQFLEEKHSLMGYFLISMINNEFTRLLKYISEVFSNTRVSVYDFELLLRIMNFLSNHDQCYTNSAICLYLAGVSVSNHSLQNLCLDFLLEQWSFCEIKNFSSINFCCDCVDQYQVFVYYLFQMILDQKTNPKILRILTNAFSKGIKPSVFLIPLMIFSENGIDESMIQKEFENDCSWIVDHLISYLSNSIQEFVAERILQILIAINNIDHSLIQKSQTKLLKYILSNQSKIVAIKNIDKLIASIIDDQTSNNSNTIIPHSPKSIQELTHYIPSIISLSL